MPFLEQRLARFGISPGLGRMKKLCNALGNPQDKLKVILVTGTNGKGSTTSYLASILTHAGYRTGAYFSPHLVDYTERIAINGIDIPKERFFAYEKKLLELHTQGLEMTLFEALTAMAYLYFQEERCEYAVMEIGMGGTYDATNLANECAAVITTIELDHMFHLGKTIEAIAQDKSGIIKTAGICVTGAGGTALDLIRKRTSGQQVPLATLGNEITISKVETTPEGTFFDYCGINKYKKLKTSLAGGYQASNAALAIRICEHLVRGISEEAVRTGLLRAKNQGRMQVLGTDPYVVVDGAHNPQGMEMLVKNLPMYNTEQIVAVFGVMKDKDWKRMLDILTPTISGFVLTAPHMERAEDPFALDEYIGKRKPTIVIENANDALEIARKQAGKRDLVIVCGSLYLVGEILGKQNG